MKGVWSNNEEHCIHDITRLLPLLSLAHATSILQIHPNVVGKVASIDQFKLAFLVFEKTTFVTFSHAMWHSHKYHVKVSITEVKSFLATRPKCKLVVQLSANMKNYALLYTIALRFSRILVVISPLAMDKYPHVASSPLASGSSFPWFTWLKANYMRLYKFLSLWLPIHNIIQLYNCAPAYI